MLSRYIRVIHSDNGTLTDYSLDSQNRDNTFTLPITSGDDYLYVGQYYPFNHLYFSVSTANTNASTISIDVWNNEWTSAVDILDGTASSGKSMAQSGVVQWDLNRDDSGWTELHDPTDEGLELGFNTLNIYDMYWVRISFSSDLSSGSELKHIGYKFANDNDLAALAPDINDYLGSWAEGKTDWEEQLLEGSKQTIEYLKKEGLVRSDGGILRFDEVNTPCAYKTLQIIFEGLGGQTFRELRDEMMSNFYKQIKKAPIVVDTNLNAQVDKNQEVNKTYFGRLVR